MPVSAWSPLMLFNNPPEGVATQYALAEHKVAYYEMQKKAGR